MAVMEISIVPLGTGNASVSGYVAAALTVLKREKGITYELHPMGTVIEADSVKKLLAVAAKMHRTVLSGKIKRVVTSLKIDDRRDKKLSMRGKIKAVKDKMDGGRSAPMTGRLGKPPSLDGKNTQQKKRGGRGAQHDQIEGRR